MKVYLKRPVAEKLAQALADHPDRDVQTLARHLATKAEQASKFLTGDELEAVLGAVDSWVTFTRANGGDLRTQVDFRRVLSARPKLASFLDSTRKREAQGKDPDEDTD